MNNGTIIKIILLSIIILLLAAILTLLLIKDDVNIFNINKGEIIFEESYDVKDIDINTKTSGVNIHSTNDSKIKIVVNGEKKDKIEVNDGNILKINYKQKNHFISFIDYKIDIYLPNNFDKNISINATTGSIKSEMPLNDLKLKLTTGSVKLDEVNNLDAKLTTGSIKAEKINNKVVIDTTTGSINISEANIKEDSSIKTTTGSIKIENINDGLFIEANTTNGSVKNNAKTDHFSKVALSVKTTTGSIKIK